MTRRRYDAEAAPAAPSIVETCAKLPESWAWWLGRASGPVGALVAIGICIGVKVQWQRAIVIVALSGVGTSALVFALVSLFLFIDELRAHRDGRPQREKKSPSEVEHPQLQPIIIHKGESSGKGKHERYDGLPIPKQGPEALARYFWRILREHRTLAFRNPYHIGRDEVQQVKDFFTDPENELGEDLGGTLGVEPNDAGRQLMWAFVKRHIPGATLPPEDVP